MSDTFVLQYKCRRCGDIHDGGFSAKAQAVSILLTIIGGDVPPGAPQTMTALHHCADDAGIGISDLIGCDYRSIP